MLVIADCGGIGIGVPACYLGLLLALNSATSVVKTQSARNPSEWKYCWAILGYVGRRGERESVT